MVVSLAEGAISTEEDIEARLWWIRGHLGAFTLPVSLLAAPFETVCVQLVGNERLDLYASLIQEIGDLVLARLRDVGDHRQEQAVKMALKKLGMLSASSFVSADSSALGFGVAESSGHLDRGHHTEIPVRSMRLGADTLSQGIRPYFRAALVCLFLIALLGSGWWSGYFSTPRMLTAREDLIGLDLSPGMIQPATLAKPVSSNLGAIYYSIERESPNTVQTPPIPDPADPKGSSQPTSQTNIPERSRPNTETVRTDGPIEGPEFTKAVERSRSAQYGPPQPRLPELRIESDANSSTGQSYPDGSLNIGGEIRSALVRSDVFDRPNYTAQVIARLLPGDKVSVEGRVGEWVRIRSRKGRAGFVAAQDIGELEEFDVNSGSDQRR